MTPEEGLRRRLETLNRGPLPAGEVSSGPSANGSLAVNARPATAAARRGLAPAIAGLMQRAETVANESGEHAVIVVKLDELWPGGESLVQKRHAQLTSTAGSTEEPSDIQRFVAAFPGRVVLVDLETCGLSGSAMFLAGMLREIGGGLAVELLLARNYAEEPAVLASLWQRLADADMIVTFNGKSFDWPMIVERSRRHLLLRGRPMPAPRHLDLLHAARRRWRRQLPDCKLQTLEEHICSRRRGDDIPGAQIPTAYLQYVRTGYQRELEQILHHNALDLVTLLDLVMRLA